MVSKPVPAVCAVSNAISVYNTRSVLTRIRDKDDYKDMRVRNFREEDAPALLAVRQIANTYDGLPVPTEAENLAWLQDPQTAAYENIFVITDDDDELQTWGQAGTLEGIEGLIIGYTWIHLYDSDGYHLLCEGTVLPVERGRNAGRALLVSVLNRARYLAEDFEFEAESAAIPIYFEVLFPARATTASRLATKCELTRVEDATVKERGGTSGVDLYRRML
jgi:GNAT superfamily N-acetyltransferase